MNTIKSGDVLRHTRLDGTTDYIRVGGPHPAWPTNPRVFVMNCDAYGHLIGTTGRYLLASTLTSRYRPHTRPEETYQ